MPSATEPDKTNKRKTKSALGEVKRKALEPRTAIEADSRQYDIVSVISPFGFGHLYVIENAESKQRFWMKTEFLPPKRMSQELAVLEDARRLSEKKRKHFMILFDKGKTSDFKFLVIELLGRSLSRLRYDVLKCNFSRSTALQLGLQTLSAIEELHKLGYVHRDIMPQNFAIGANERETVIYMIELGSAKKIREKEEKSKPSEKKDDKTYLPVKWASRAAHKKEEITKKDDLECWLYMLVDFFDESALPWTHTTDLTIMENAKDLFMRELIPDMYAHTNHQIPKKLSFLFEYLTTVPDPSIDRIKFYMKMIANLEGIDLAEPLDWAGHLPAVDAQGTGSSENAPKNIPTFQPNTTKHMPFHTVNDEEQKSLWKRLEEAAEEALEQERAAKDRTCKRKEEEMFVETGNEISIPVGTKELKPGVIVYTAHHRYEVCQLVVEGQYRDEYVVENMENKTRLMMKALLQHSMSIGTKRLKTELSVLLDARGCGGRHFLAYMDRAMVNGYKFLLTDLYGYSIFAIRKYVMQHNFSKSTALQIALQTFEAIEELHRIGWLHRHVRPENFAVGPNDRENIVYMTDFGISRRFRNKKGEHFLPRKKTQFYIDTVKWASQAAMRGEDQGRKEDLEMWLFMAFDLFDDTSLPWRCLKDLVSIQHSKELFIKEQIPEALHRGPKSAVMIMRLLNVMSYADEPDYKLIRTQLLVCAAAEDVDMSEPLDWQGCLPPIRATGDQNESPSHAQFIPNTQKHRPLEKKAERAPDEAKALQTIPSNYITARERLRPASNEGCREMSRETASREGIKATSREPASKEKLSKEQPSSENAEGESTFGEAQYSQELADKTKAKKLVPGTIIPTARGIQYEVQALLKSGKFKDIYVIEDIDSNKRYQLRAVTNQPMGLARLTTELTVLLDCRRVESRHFIRYADKARANDFRFLITELHSKNLEEIRTEVMGYNFSKSTALQIGVQTLEAIEELHSLGWLHRNIRPECFAVGTNENEKVIYMVDFGIARRYKDKDRRGQIIPPRTNTKFYLETAKWAPLSAMRGEDQGRKDDLEMWLYMVLDLFSDSALPWRFLRDRKAIYHTKDLFMQEKIPEALSYCPKNTAWIIRMIQKMKFEDEPDYSRIHHILLYFATAEKVDLHEPVDWTRCIGGTKMNRADTPDQPLAFQRDPAKHRVLEKRMVEVEEKTLMMDTAPPAEVKKGKEEKTPILAKYLESLRTMAKKPVKKRNTKG